MSPSFDLRLPQSTFTTPCATIVSPHSFKCHVELSRRMANSPLSATVIKVSLSQLSPELLSLVFEQLRDIDHRSLQKLRQVSKRFNVLATPISYRTLELNEIVVLPGAKQQYPHLFEHIAAYTNHVIIRSDLNLDGIRKVLSGARRLASIQWQYVDGQHPALPLEILDRVHTRSNRMKLSVERLPLREFEGPLDSDYLGAIPPSQLLSLNLVSSAPHLTTKLGSLKRLLLQSYGLEVFHYEDRGQGTSFDFSDAERLPALTDLVLQSYNWNHSTEAVERHWDFSRIRSLQLVSVPIFNFLASVHFPDFSHLHTLRVEDYSAHLPDRRLDATKGLYLLIKSHIRALEVLDITCHTQVFPLDALLPHRHTLRVLRIRDHVGFEEEDRNCPMLAQADLTRLSQRLPFVHTLELDMDTRRCDVSAFLRAINSFGRLQTLTLHVQTLVRPFETGQPDTDKDYDAAMRIFRLLTQLRNQTSPDYPWRSIIINVGGWRRVMVRRLGAAWKELNTRGIFAERCFVMEKNQDGRLVVREEMSAEALSRWPSPEL